MCSSDLIKADVKEHLTQENAYTKAMLASTEGLQAAMFEETAIEQNRLWVSNRESYGGIGYNSNSIPDAEAPKVWKDLLNPKYKGKMIWGDALDSGGPLVVLHILKTLGEQRANALFDKLAKQEVASSSASGRAISDLVVAGEHAMNISAAGPHIVDSKSTGASVDWVEFDPVIARSDQLQILKSAPHPYAAMLLIEALVQGGLPLGQRRAELRAPSDGRARRTRARSRNPAIRRSSGSPSRCRPAALPA